SSGRWSAICDDCGLAAGQYDIIAGATGSDNQGGETTKTSDKVSFSIAAAKVELKPEIKPLLEPEPQSKPESKTEPEPQTKPEPEVRTESASEQPAAQKQEEAAQQEETPKEEPRSPAFNDLRASLDVLEKSDLNASVAPGVSGANPLSANDLCVQNGILPERCSQWLEVRFADKTCTERGITTRESCEKFLTDGNGGVFPGCQDKTAEECQAIKNLTTVGYLPAEVRDKANAAIQELIDEKKVADLPGLMPLEKKELKDVGWWKSAAGTGAETSPGVLVVDTDGDKLPDDFEKLIGTDPTKADSDDDGAGDSDELKKGTDPLGKGNLKTKLSPVETTIVFRKPLGQPRGSGKVDPAFGVELTAKPANQPVNAPSKKQEVHGRCAPKSVCILYIYSYIPMVYTASSDADGNFTYTIDQSLIDGEHTVYVAVTDDTGKITSKSNPLAFFIKTAQAVTKEDFIRADVNVSQAPAAEVTRNYLWGALLLIPIAALAVWQIARRPKKRSQ
ncbi:MAG: Ig-like domain-containing protein, partial [Patescibacteria group bacterium]